MDFVPSLTGVRLLTGLLIMFAASVVALPYFTIPEDFFVKRLRPAPDLEITHARLLTRAFLGGLSSVSVTLLGTALVTGDASAYFLRLSLSATLICGSFIGVGAYIYFRLWRYREMSPEEFGASGSQSRSVFIRRETSNRISGLLRIGLILIALPAMWAAIILSSLVADLIS